MSSPYDLIESVMLTAKGPMKVMMRPYRFDSDPVDLNTLKNAFGYVIKPTQLSSSCPHCGVMVDVPFNNDMTYRCIDCYKEPKRKIVVPFVADPLTPLMDLVYTHVDLEDPDSNDDNLSNLLNHLGMSNEDE